MATEASFVTKLNKRPALRTVYSCGMGGLYVSGIPDRYYEGTKNSCWIEFKYIKTDTLTFNAAKRITALQKAWLMRAHTNNQNALVIVGVGLNHCFILDAPWEWVVPWNPKNYGLRLLSIDAAATYIQRVCNGTR